MDGLLYNSFYFANCKSAAGEEEQLSNANAMIAGKRSTGMIAGNLRAQQARCKATE